MQPPGLLPWRPHTTLGGALLCSLLFWYWSGVERTLPRYEGALLHSGGSSSFSCAITCSFTSSPSLVHSLFPLHLLLLGLEVEQERVEIGLERREPGGRRSLAARPAAPELQAAAHPDRVAAVASVPAISREKVVELGKATFASRLPSLL